MNIQETSGEWRGFHDSGVRRVTLGDTERISSGKIIVESWYQKHTQSTQRDIVRENREELWVD